jgi:SAM-dependent methyltransferase
MAYERDLERWIPRLVAVWRKAARRPGDVDRLAPAELKGVARGVQRLSAGLTRERKLAGARYLDDPELLGAYLLFYWPISYLQGRAAMGELPRRPGAVLDLGSGPGPLAFAALDAGASEVTACDRSAAALEAARALAVEAEESLATRQWDPLGGGKAGGRGAASPLSLEALAPPKSHDLVTMGHLLNELWGPGVRGANSPPPMNSLEGSGAEPGAIERRTALCEAAASLLRPGGTLLVIEPALRDTSRALLAVRDRLVSGGWAVRAPCLWRGPCPALERESDWCHAEHPVEPPPLVGALARAAGLRKEAVKMSYLLLAAPGEDWAPPPPGRVFRIVSEPLPSKGRLRYMGCGPEGRMGLSLQERHLDEGNRRFERLARGDVIEVSEVEGRGDGLALGPGSRVGLVAGAGRPLPGPTVNAK